MKSQVIAHTTAGLLASQAIAAPLRSAQDLAKDVAHPPAATPVAQTPAVTLIAKTLAASLPLRLQNGAPQSGDAVAVDGRNVDLPPDQARRRLL